MIDVKTAARASVTTLITRIVKNAQVVCAQMPMPNKTSMKPAIKFTQTASCTHHRIALE
jgi:hypothetical protein